MIKALRKICRVALRCIPPCVVSHKKNSIVFVSYPDVSDNSFALFQYLYENLDDRWSYNWLVQDIDVARTITKRDCPAINMERVRFFAPRNIPLWYRTRLFDYQFDTTGASYSKNQFKKFLSVSLWHGSPLKAIGNLVAPGVIKESPDLFCSAHPRFNPFLAAGMAMYEEGIMITGYPRNDWLTGTLPSYNPVSTQNMYIVWMPTFARSSGLVTTNTCKESKSNSLRIERTSYKGTDSSIEQNSLGCMLFSELPLLEQHLASLDMRLIIKLHSHDDRNLCEFESLSHIEVIRGNDPRMFGSGLYGLLHRSVALISDCSSVIFDYALTEKPIAIDMTSLHGYTRPLNFPFPADGDEELYQVRNREDVMSFLTEVRRGARTTGKFKEKFNAPSHRSFSENVARAVGLL